MTGQQIRKLRKRLGLSQPELAELLSVTKSAVCQWETGATKPREIYVRLLRELKDRQKVA